MFATRSWVGPVLPPQTAPKDQLVEYTRILSAVEGNSTFYALPKPETIAKWALDAPEDFRFAFKIPGLITHELELLNFEEPLQRFLRTLEPLVSRLGPCMLQLPPAAGRPAGTRIRRFLERWPSDWPLSVEVRHPDWFDEGRNEHDLHRLLTHFGVERVCLDSRPLFSVPAGDDESTAHAQSRKPRVPVRYVALGSTPIVRFIGLNEPAWCDVWLGDWAQVVAGWIREGRSPIVFCHAPDEHFAPALARRFHNYMRKYEPRLDALGDWPLAAHNKKQLHLL